MSRRTKNEVTAINPSIEGWKVKNLTNCGHHSVAASKGSDRGRTIPLNAEGTLTGEMIIFPRGVHEALCRSFAEDGKRIRQALERAILSHDLGSTNRESDYWHQTEMLTGDDLLASRIALVVDWDGTTELRTAGRSYASYIPWLALAES